MFGAAPQALYIPKTLSQGSEPPLRGHPSHPALALGCEVWVVLFFHIILTVGWLHQEGSELSEPRTPRGLQTLKSMLSTNPGHSRSHHLPRALGFFLLVDSGGEREKSYKKAKLQS